MRLNNIKAKQTVISIYFVFIVLLFFSSFSFSYISGLIRNSKLKYAVLFGVLIASFFIIHKIAKYFEYDSDGNVLVVLNKGLLLSEFFNYRENRAEFPKHRLLYYKINNYGIYKTLNLYISSGENKHKRIKFNITMVKNKKIKYLKQSLDKVVKKNKEKTT